MAIVLDSSHVDSPMLGRCSVTVVLGRPSVRGFRGGIGGNNVVVCSKCKVRAPIGQASIDMCHISTVSTTARVGGRGTFGVLVLNKLLGVIPVIGLRGILLNLGGSLPRHRRGLVPVGRTTVGGNVRVVAGIRAYRWNT